MPGEITDLRGRAPTGEWSVVAACAWRADALTKVAALATDDQRDGLLRRLGGRLVDSRSLDACAA
jgi:thiamine biosynthesis lipoprotein